MDRGSKRKAALAASPEYRAAKRQKTPDPVSETPPDESLELVTAVGLRFMQQLRAAADKSGNLVATDFLTLPSREEYPDYYEQTAMPLAIDTIEGKLERKEYPDVSAVESDVKRLIQNAKDFNESSSIIFQNAERIRKLTHNFMSKNNPAHKDRNYQPHPTPLPTHTIRLSSARKPSPPAAAEQSKQNGPSRTRAKSTTQEPSRSESAQKATPGADLVSDGQERPFGGRTFQQAQEQIIEELLEAKEPDGDLKIFEPFANLPTRQLVDYYKVIKEPTSLKGVLKKIRGIHGRHESTGTTDFKSWDAFETEVRKIWDNARIYNEDGSDISNLSSELEEHFLRRLADAKKAVAEPPQQTLKLNMSKPAPLKLRLGSHKQSPGPQSALEEDVQPRPQTKTPTPGVSVDQSALERQRQHVQAGVNGHSASHVQSEYPKAKSGSPSIAVQAPKSNASAGSPPAPPNGIKSESQQSQSPAPGAVAAATTSTTAAMPPPARLANGTSPHLPQLPAHHQVYPPPPPPAGGPDSKWRQPGKGIADALISNVSICTHPSLSTLQPAQASVPAHPRLTQQSITLNLLPHHHALQMAVALGPSLSANRAYKLFVTANGQRLSPAAAPTTIAGADGAYSKRSLFDVKLGHGVNRIEVECVAISAPARSNSNGAGGSPAPPTPSTAVSQLEVEKVTCFVHLLR